jgi:hypothetical protein
MAIHRTEMRGTQANLSAALPPRTLVGVRFGRFAVHRNVPFWNSRARPTIAPRGGVRRAAQRAPAHCSSAIGRAVADVGFGASTVPREIASMASCASGESCLSSRTAATGTRRSRPAYPNAMSPRVSLCPSWRTLIPRMNAASCGRRSCRLTSPTSAGARLIRASRAGAYVPRICNRSACEPCYRNATDPRANPRKSTVSGCAIVRTLAQDLCPLLRGSARTFSVGVCMARPGLEPGTPRFSVVCSTN